MLTSKKVKKPLLKARRKERRVIRELDSPYTRRDCHQELPFQSPNRFRTMIENAQDVICVVSVAEKRILHVNQAISLYLGHEPAALLGRTFASLFPPNETLPTSQVPEETDVAFDAVFRDQAFVHKNGDLVIMDITATLIPWDFRDAILMTIRGTEERRAAEEQQAALIEELKVRLRQVETLSGLLPICSHCKRIRNAQGDWDAVEAFVTERSEAKFTHSVCPTCIGEHYFELGIDFDE